MTVDPLSLSAGYRFPRRSFSVTAAQARDYLHAIDDPWPGYRLPEASLAPLLIVARGLGLLMAEIGLPPGSIHGSQECTVLREARPGTVLAFEAEVSRAATRQGQRFVTIDVAALDGDQVVCRGRSLLIIPADAGVRTG